MKVIKINSKENLDELIREGFSLVVFKASWCINCTEMEPILKQLARKYENVLLILLIDIDECFELCDYFSINIVPTYVLFKNGIRLDQLCYGNKDNLNEFISSYL